MKKAIETIHPTYIGYHGYAEDWLKDNPDLTRELANRCGYWYFPAGSMFSKVLKKGNNSVIINWLNMGVAPAYKDYPIIFRLENTRNGKKTDLIIENSGNTKWLPDLPVREEYVLNLDERIPSGRYILKLKLVENQGDDPVMIDVGLKKECFDREGFVVLGKVII
jgi:hypothetical protein